MRAIKPSRFGWFDYSRYTFSLGVEREGNVWLSGHSASTYDKESKHIVVRGGMAEQTRTAYDKIGAILEAAGLAPGNVHRIVEYVTSDGIAHYAEAAEVRADVFGDHRPAVCTVVVKRLLRPQALIEIEVTAGPPGQPSPDGAYEADGVVYLSSLTAPEAGGDLVAQMQAVFEKGGRVLEACGLSWSNAVKTVDYTMPATLDDYKRTGRVRKDFLGPVYPAAAGIVMEKLQTPDTLCSLDVIATRYEPAAVNPGWDRYEKLTYSPAVRAGNLLFMSGQAALDPASGHAVHAGDVVAQAEYTYANILEVLRAAGGGPENLVKTIEYVTPSGLARYREVARVREAVLREPYPASTGCVCDLLLRPEFEIEVDPLAVLG